MNCKPGDLAIVVRSPSGLNLGKLVTVVDAAPGLRDWIVRAHGPVYGTVRLAHEGDTLLADDNQLRPIRDNDGDDETLTWAAKPEALPVTSFAHEDSEAK